MAEGARRTRAAGWLLLGMAAVALAGCFERHEPGNPFIGPFGDATEGSFGALPAASGGQDLARAAQPVPVVAMLLSAEVPWAPPPPWAQADAFQPAAEGSSLAGGARRADHRSAAPPRP